MGREVSIAVASVIGSLVGLVTPFAAVALARTVVGRADSIFEYGLFFGGPLAGAVIGAVAGVRRGRDLPAEASGLACWRAVGRAAVAGLAWSLGASTALGTVLWVLLSGWRG